jgi:hypothetical protein
MMRTSLLPSLLVAAALLALGGCSREAPSLGATLREKPAPQATTPETPPSPATPPPVLAEKVSAAQQASPKAPAVKAPAAAPVREKVGAGQCRACHRLQYDSWVKSGHARKALDCEGCHGNGSDYAKAAVMKDPARAKAAGLIFQTADFCEKCHPTADASYLPKAHAHKQRHVPPAAP